MKRLLSNRWLLLGLSTALISRIGVAAPGERVKIGQLQQWAVTQAAVGLDGELWSLEGDVLHRTDADGNYLKVGDKGPWQNEVALAELGGEFFVVDSNKSMYRATKNGEWKRLAKKSPDIAAMTALDGELWATDKTGTLYHGDREGNWLQVGSVGLTSLKGLVALDGELWTLQNGTIAHSAKNGIWTNVGEDGAWRATAFVAPLQSAIWGIEDDGDLMRSQKDGKSNVVGRGKWSRTVALVPLEDGLWTFENDGTLFYTQTQ